MVTHIIEPLPSLQKRLGSGEFESNATTKQVSDIKVFIE